MGIGRHGNRDRTTAAVVEMPLCDIDECLEIPKELKLCTSRKPAQIVPLFDLCGEVHVRNPFAAGGFDERAERH